jgi:phosphosulfolactate phosphohydrolase-like enzyme
MFLAQVEFRKDMPFAITTNLDRLIPTAKQGKIRDQTLGEY